MSNDRPTSPAPGTDVEVTPAMIEAAERAIWETHDQHMAPDGGGYVPTDEFLTLVFRAMSRSREASRASPPETSR